MCKSESKFFKMKLKLHLFLCSQDSEYRCMNKVGILEKCQSISLYIPKKCQKYARVFKILMGFLLLTVSVGTAVQLVC